MTERVPRLFVAALADLTQWLEAAGVPAMILGGIAASILGRPRWFLVTIIVHDATSCGYLKATALFGRS